MNFWRRLRFYLIGVSLGLVISFSFFKNRGCAWLPGNRILNQLSSSLILCTDSVRCLMHCSGIADEDVFVLIKNGDVLFKESETESSPKKYVVQGNRKSDESEFKLAFVMRDSTAEVNVVSGSNSCNCSHEDNSTAKILMMPEEMTRELFLSKDISATSHSDCQIKCRGWDGSAIRTMILEGRIDYSKSQPRAHPHPLYSVQADSVILSLELTEKKTRVLNVEMVNDSLCLCSE